MRASRTSTRRMSPTAGGRSRDRLYLHLFSTPLAVPSGPSGPAFEPPTDVYETETDVVVRMEIARADKRRMDVKFDPPTGELTIRGFRGDPTAGKQRVYHQLEVVYGPFERVIQILVPVEEDNLRAEYADGLLHIYLPKKKQRRTELSVNIE